MEYQGFFHSKAAWFHSRRFARFVKNAMPITTLHDSSSATQTTPRQDGKGFEQEDEKTASRAILGDNSSRGKIPPPPTEQGGSIIPTVQAAHSNLSDYSSVGAPTELLVNRCRGCREGVYGTLQTCQWET